MQLNYCPWYAREWCQGFRDVRYQSYHDQHPGSYICWKRNIHKYSSALRQTSSLITSCKVGLRCLYNSCDTFIIRVNWWTLTGKNHFYFSRQIVFGCLRDHGGTEPLFNNNPASFSWSFSWCYFDFLSTARVQQQEKPEVHSNGRRPKSTATEDAQNVYQRKMPKEYRNGRSP